MSSGLSCFLGPLCGRGRRIALVIDFYSKFKACQLEPAAADFYLDVAVSLALDAAFCLFS